MTTLRMVPLGELLTPHEDWFSVLAGEKYTEITVKLHGKGVVRRSDGFNPAKVGARRNRIRAGQFIASRIDARNGAFGIVPPELSGGIVSQDFPVFDVHGERVVPSFLNWFTRTPQFVDLCRQSSLGTTNRARLATDVFLQQRVPLPPLEEQRRVVQLLDQSEEIRRRTDAARAKARAIIPALFFDMFGDPTTNPKGWRQVRFSEVVSEFRYGTNQKCHDSKSDGDVAVLRIPNVIGGRINWSDLKFAVLPEKERVKTDLRTGDVLFVRTNGNPEYIGRCAMFDGNHSASYASYLIRARLSGELLPYFAVINFNHERYRPLVVRAGRTTAGNFNLSTEGLGALSVMVPPLPLQTAFAEQGERFEAAARALDAAATKAAAMCAALSVEVFEHKERHHPGADARTVSGRCSRRSADGSCGRSKLERQRQP